VRCTRGVQACLLFHGASEHSRVNFIMSSLPRISATELSGQWMLGGASQNCLALAGDPYPVGPVLRGDISSGAGFPYIDWEVAPICGAQDEKRKIGPIPSEEAHVTKPCPDVPLYSGEIFSAGVPFDSFEGAPPCPALAPAQDVWRTTDYRLASPCQLEATSCSPSGYDLSHVDVDMSSADKVAALKSEGSAAPIGVQEVHGADKESEFLSGDEAPCLPGDPFFQLLVTTLHVRAAKAYHVGNTILCFLREELSVTTMKLRRAKFTAKAEVLFRWDGPLGFSHASACTVKWRMYRVADVLFAVEVQRRTGDCVAFAGVFRKFTKYVEARYQLAEGLPTCKSWNSITETCRQRRVQRRSTPT